MPQAPGGKSNNPWAKILADKKRGTPDYAKIEQLEIDTGVGAEDRLREHADKPSQRGQLGSRKAAPARSIFEYEPTEEQNKIREAAKTGKDGVMEAGAGTGKTSTLKMLANDRPKLRHGFLAFNRSIADDAKAEFPHNTTVSTMHSFAFRALGNQYVTRMDGPRLPAWQQAKALGMHPVAFGEHAPFSQQKLGRFVIDALKKFCYSRDETPNRSHIAFFQGAEDFIEDLRDYLMPYVNRAWDDVQQKTGGKMRFEQDYYLKMWALTNPRLPFDVVMVDEAQDSNPCSVHIVEQQDAQKLMVGDRSQSIYGWRGATDAMSSFKGDWRLVLSQSFRFGPAIANEANKFLTVLDAPLRLTGFDKIASTVETLTEPKTVLCRTNAMVVQQALAAQEANRRPAIVGGASDIKRFAEAADKLMNGKPVDHPDLIAFANWNEVQEYVADEGGDLKRFVNVIDTYGVAKVIEIADKSVDEKNADVILSTAHKAKGREWDTVQIAGDFTEPASKEGEPLDPENGYFRSEAMLAYVAVTRAKLKLDNDGLSWIDHHIPQSTEQKETA